MQLEDQTEFTPDRGAWAAAVAVMAAGWLYLLVFARLGAAELARPMVGGEEWRLRFIVLLLGGGGVLGCLAAGWRFQLLNFQRGLSWACRFCGAAAALALTGAGWTAALISALVAGVALGWLAVSLTSGLRASVGTGGLGRAIGAGAGLGFALAHVPVLFEASARVQTIWVAFAILAVSVLTPLLTPQEPSLSTAPGYSRPGAVRWGAILLGLTVLAVAFPLGGHAPTDTRSGSWPAVFVPGLVATGAGWWLDRGRGRPLVPVMGLALVVLWGVWVLPAGSLAGSILAAAAAGAMALGVIYYPARGGEPRLTAAILAVAGAGGCLLGTWMAQWPGRPPLVAMAVITLACTSALIAHWRTDRAMRA